jgi:hypothetical protein
MRRCALQRARCAAAGAALRWLHEIAQAQADSIVFFSANDGSGAHVAEQEAWRAAQIAPQAPWYQPAQAGRSLIAQIARKAPMRSSSAGPGRSGRRPSAILVEAIRGLTEPIHAMRSFRSPHLPARCSSAWSRDARPGGSSGAQRGYACRQPDAVVTRRSSPPTPLGTFRA